MQDPFKEKEGSYFVFTVATEKGTALGGFGDLINEMVGAVHEIQAAVCSRMRYIGHPGQSGQWYHRRVE